MSKEMRNMINNFKKLLKESVENEKLYHGNRKGDFPPEKTRFGAIFLTPNVNFAKNFAGYDEREEFPNGAVFEVKLKSGLKMCDPMNEDSWKGIDIESVLNKMISEKYVDPVNGQKFLPVTGKGLKGYNPKTKEEFEIDSPEKSVYHYLWRLKNGAWRIIECKPIIDKIKSLNYDGYYVVEGSTKNVAIFDKSSIESFKKLS